ANAGPMTEMLFRETAVHAMVSTVTGWHLWEMASTRNKYKNRATPLEARIGMEVGHAVACQGLSRAEVNVIAKNLLVKYEDHAADAPIGCEYHECYDVAKAVPTQEHFDMYRRIKDEIADMGIEFPY
ncbi:MAG TPA: monomethylamine:corrinoid methyltransferase, partial [Desulfobacteraceae bacterium]|nr:monomethylamine:corrinoid methyltransferase [Desulfobacteraceae bacterium]